MLSTVPGTEKKGLVDGDHDMTGYFLLEGVLLTRCSQFAVMC